MCMHRRSERAEHRAEHRGGTMTMPADDVRVSSAERDEVIDQLKEHAADGRLTLDEMSDRVEEALNATTGGELRKVLRQLPPVGRSRSGHRPEGNGPRIRGVVPALLLAVLVAAAVASGCAWALFPLGWFFLARGPGHRGRRGLRRHQAA